MADDNTYRSYRSNEPQRGGAQPSGSGGDARDPLAELARLIGQGDPFGDFGRGNARSAARAPQQPPPQASRTESQYPPADAEFTRHDPYQMASAVEETAESPHEPGYHRREPQFAPAQPPLRQRQETPAYAAATSPLPRQQPYTQQRPYFEDGAAMTPHDEDAYDDPSPPRRRGGLVTAVTLIGCAMIGTAAAYGYRTYYVAPSASKAPPVITAEATPSKIVPVGDFQSGKMIQDRVGEPVPNERVVSREEQPVELRNPPAAPRVIPTAPAQSSRSGFPPVSNAPPSTTATIAPAAPQAGGVPEPKRIRTVPIRPDGAEVNRPVGNLGQPAPAAKSAPPARNAVPLSLDPQANALAQSPSGPRDRVAAVPPATTQSLPTQQPAAPQLAAAPSGGTGGYLVQLSSQRSEPEAQASYRALQAKFPDQLSGYSAVVRRVDLGAKGIYFRAMVGPFASSGDADQFCTGLKAAGGQCFIQRN